MELSIYKPLLWLLLLLPVGAAFAFSLVNRKRHLKRIAFGLRVMGIILLILALCRPYVKISTDRKHIVFLIDISESVSLDSVAAAARETGAALASIKPGDSASVFCFADGAEKSDPKRITEKIEAWKKTVSDDDFRKATKIAEAFQSVGMVFPSDKASQIVLFSDGMDNGGRGLPEAVASLSQKKVDIRFAPMRRLDYPEAAVLSLNANTATAYAGESVRFTATLTANRDMRGILKFINRDVVLKTMTVELKKDRKLPAAADFSIAPDCGNLWSVELFPEKDHFPINNKASCAVAVKGRLKVLALHVKPSDLRHFVRAMRAQGIDVETRGRTGCPGSMTEMLDFDAIILADFPATAMTFRQMEMLKRYVADYGRGLIMTGSENSFGLGGYYKTPVEDVLPVVSRYEKEKELPSLGMVLVIDKSGSMGGIKIELARQAAKAAVELLGSRDYIGVIAFDGQPYVVSEMVSAINSGQVSDAIDGIAAGGGTNLYPAMLKGKEMLEQTVAKIKHMIVLSDGQSTPGDFDGVTSEMANLGMTVSTVALGAGADSRLMSGIAEIGKGRFYETMDAGNVPRIFAKETITASRSAIKEEPFAAVRIGDADYLDGLEMEKAPYLLGYVMTRSRPTAQTQLLCENGDPLLASGRFGLGRGIGFTSDITAKWAGEWLDWKNFGKFWSQVIRSAVNPADSSGIYTSISGRGDTVMVNIRRKDDNGQPLAAVKWNAVLSPPDGNPREITVSETGYGLYALEFAKPKAGDYNLTLTDTTNNKTKIIYLKTDYPEEYLLTAGQPDVIKAMPRFDSNSTVARTGTVNAGFPASNLLCILALLCILGSILFRRI